MRGDHDAVDVVVGFARTLRAAGVSASQDMVQEFTRALSALDPSRERDVYWAGRVTLCTQQDDLPRYDAAFAAYFRGQAPPRPPRTRHMLQQHLTPVQAEEPQQDRGEDEEETETKLQTAASSSEVLRHRDFTALTPAERAELARLLAALRLPGDTRRTRRYAPAHRGPIDREATVRELLRRGGEPARLRYHRHRRRPRRVVLLVDVSGSMSLYSTALLRFAHATARRGQSPAEVFTMGTRLTRVTRELRHPDPDLALAAVADAVPDWSGGTRLGVLLKEFLDRWGQRGLARGAVVVLLSDGWERGDPRLLGEQMERLARLAHRVVWANPRKGQPNYAPLAGGMSAALPHVDDFVAGHSLAALEHLARVVAGGARGPLAGQGRKGRA